MKKLIILAIAVISTTGINAQTAEERGLEIAKAAEQADLGFGGTTVELKMALKNKNGQTGKRSPTKQGQSIWSYLPSIKRVKRISSNNLS